MTDKGIIRTGTAGWIFEPWRGTFFPEGLVQKQELHFASRQLTSIEINATFRQRQKPETFAKWAAETPDGFEFSIKGHQQITHYRRLKDCRQPLANFFGSGPLALGSRLGPFIWQLPDNLKLDLGRLADFLALLPQDIDAYLALARDADGAKGPPFLETNGVGRIRHAMEMRHPSFADPEVEALLRQHNIARVIVDTPDDPRRALTADFAYCRLQGPARADATIYSPGDIEDFARTMADWKAAGHDGYAYFVHEDKLHAPANAIALAKALGISPYQ